MKYLSEVIWASVVAAASAVLIIAGCSGSRTSPGDVPVGASGSTVAVAQPAEVSGALLWAQNCAMCHNLISPADYSDAQWDVAVMHMRMQARLTGQEERQIRKFLQSAN